MDEYDDEDTLFEITNKVDTIEKPKRVATQRQLDALQKARDIRASKLKHEKETEEKLNPTPKVIVPEVPKKEKKAKKPKPTIIQIQNDTDEESENDDQPVIIIKNNNKKKSIPEPIPVPLPIPPPPPVQQKPKQYIRRA